MAAGGCCPLLPKKQKRTPRSGRDHQTHLRYPSQGAAGRAVLLVMPLAITCRAARLVGGHGLAYLLARQPSQPPPRAAIHSEQQGAAQHGSGSGNGT